MAEAYRCDCCRRYFPKSTQIPYGELELGRVNNVSGGSPVRIHDGRVSFAHLCADCTTDLSYAVNQVVKDRRQKHPAGGVMLETWPSTGGVDVRGPAGGK